MTQARIGYGSVFQTFNGTEWVSVAEATALNLPPLTRDVVDAGHECAPDEWRTVVTGLKNAGEIGVELNFTAAEYQARYADLLNGSTARRILLPDNSVYPFNAYLIGLETGVSVADKITAGAKFRVVGEPGSLITGLPFGDGEPPAFYADFQNQFYWNGNSYFDNFTDFNASVEGAFVRTTTGLARNASGVYETIAAATPRFDHDVSGKPIGLLMEATRTQWIANATGVAGIAGAGDNLVTNPSTDHVAPFAAANVAKLTRGTTGDSNMGVITPHASFNPIVSTTITFSCWVWIPASTVFTSTNGFGVTQENSTPPWSGATVAVVDKSKRDQWQQIWGIVSSGASGTSLPVFVLRLDVTVGHSIYLTMPQIEQGPMPSTWIASPVGAIAARADEGFAFPLARVIGNAASAKGTMLTYNSLPYTPAATDSFRIAFYLWENSTTANGIFLLKLPDATGAGRAELNRNGSALFLVDTFYPWLASTPIIKNAIAWEHDATAYAQGNVYPTAPNPSILPPINLQEFQVATNGMMLCKAIAYWPKRVSDAELKRLTTP